MITRHPYRTSPIPFSNNAMVFQSPTSGHSGAALLAGEPKRSPWGNTIAQLSQPEKSANNTPRPTPTRHGHTDQHSATASSKTTRARYDGPHALSIRSATSGRHYRFEHPGAEQVIDTIDIALLRRIEGITIL